MRSRWRRRMVNHASAIDSRATFLIENIFARTEGVLLVLTRQRNILVNRTEPRSFLARYPGRYVREKPVRQLVLAAGMAATILLAAPSDAQGRDDCRTERECRHDLEEAGGDDWRNYRHDDYSRPPSGGDYYADDYYRDGRYYPQRRLGHRDRIYRGRDGRYYCRRSDGTTGLILGAGIVGLLGNAIDPGGSAVLGAQPGAGIGGVLSLQIDSGNVRCG